MIRLQELCLYLEEYLNASAIKDCAINGLQVEGKGQITRVATAVTASAATIEAAALWGADALIVHHGIFWEGQPPALVGCLGRRARLLIENSISLLAYHLPLDLHRTIGNNWRAAAELGWENCQPFGVFSGVPIGVMGFFRPIDRYEFREKLEKYFQNKAHTALGGKEMISSAALISGGAYKSLAAAAAAGADSFITGNFDEPVWHAAHEEKINFFAMGHSATERIGPRALAEQLAKHFPVETTFLDLPNPF